MFRPPPITRNLTGAEIEHFRQYGFVRLKHVIAEEEVARLQVAMTLAVDTFDLSPAGCDLTAFAETAVAYAAGASRGGRAVADMGPFCATSLAEMLRISGAQPLVEKTSVQRRPGRSLVDVNVSARVPELSELALKSDLPRMAAALLDVPSVRLYDDLMCVKEAGAIERAAFHQNLSYLHIAGGTGCTFWIFVDPVRDGAGALGYVPASHKWGQLFKPNFLVSDLACPGSEGVDLPGIDAAPDAFGVQYVEADPGDVIVHHVQTVHGKQGNRGQKPCRGFAFRYVDAKARFQRRPGITLPGGYRGAPRNGMPLDDALHPMAWPHE
jgi:ectoine hydroxylase-related dioxygenase (phytanoyl-CoA dioxygenase family)